MPLQVDLIFQGYTSGQRNHKAHHDIHQDHVHQYTQLTQHSYTGKEQNVPLRGGGVVHEGNLLDWRFTGFPQVVEKLHTFLQGSDVKYF